MNRYDSRTAKWQQRGKEEARMNKTEFIKVRCTLEEKQRIKSKAESTGRKFSDYCREILLNGEVIAVPKMTDNEREAIELLRRTAYFFSHISNLIKVKDDAWVLITQSLSYLAREAFKRFFNPKYRIEERAIAHGSNALEYIFREGKLGKTLLFHNLCGNNTKGNLRGNEDGERL